MSIIGRLFKRRQVLELADPVFGQIAFDQGIWTFVPKSPADGFMITVDAPETGPTAEQRAIFGQFRARVGEFEQRARDYMRPRVDDAVDVSRLSTYSVEIGSGQDTPPQGFVLELSDADGIVIHRVAFRAGEAVDYGCDD